MPFHFRRLRNIFHELSVHEKKKIGGYQIRLLGMTCEFANGPNDSSLIQLAHSDKSVVLCSRFISACEIKTQQNSARRKGFSFKHFDLMTRVGILH